MRRPWSEGATVGWRPEQGCGASLAGAIRSVAGQAPLWSCHISGRMGRRPESLTDATGHRRGMGRRRGGADRLSGGDDSLVSTGNTPLTDCAFRQLMGEASRPPLPPRTPSPRDAQDELPPSTALTTTRNSMAASFELSCSPICRRHSMWFGPMADSGANSHHGAALRFSSPLTSCHGGRSCVCPVVFPFSPQL